MNSTLVLWTTLIGSQLLQWILWALFLWLGLVWAKSPAITARRLVDATLTYHLANLFCLLAIMFAWQYLQALLLPLALAYLSSLFLLPILLVCKFFHISFLRTLQALVPTLLVPVIIFSLWLGVVRTFVWESYSVTSNAMAPTLRGDHWRGTCPTCGDPRFCSPDSPDFPAGNQKRPMICEQFHLTPRDSDGTEDDTVHASDRIMVAKYRSPQRWDMVAFRFPASPENIYVMRIVGMPGETIVIKDGAVWANDERLTPPDALQNIVYLDKDEESNFFDFHGTAGNPAELADDEFFVLGDFSASSNDSRYWTDGAPGHAPFAVPRSHILGVVSHIYWPLERWRAF